VLGILLSLLSLSLLVAAAHTPPAQAQGGLPQITVPGNLDADQIEQYADKLDVYAALLAGTSRTVTNAIRYLKNFDPKKGPTGRETSTYDLLSLNGDLYADLIRKARAAATETPLVPDLDKAALAYADAVSTNVEVFNEAADYYSSARRYEEDRYEHGKTLHPKIVREIDRYFATLPPFMGFLHQVRAKIDPREIAIVERAGRAPARALARKLMTVGRQASLFVPIGPRQDINRQAFDAAIRAYLGQFDAYKAYRQSPAGQQDASLSGFSDNEVEGLYRKLREIRGAYDLRRQVPLQYELLIVPFYEDYGQFWSEMLAVVARNPWERARPAVTSGPPPRQFPAPSAVVIPDDVDPRRMPRWTEKNEAVQRLLVNTNALMTAWNSYTGWVDEHRGPTGKEGGTGQFGGIDRGQFINAARTARALARQAPKIAPLDELLERYAISIETVLPVAVEASGYYQRRDYLSDKMEGGKALHPRIMKDYRPFLEVRSDLSETVRTVRAQVDEKSLKFIEENEGKSPRWHRLRLLAMARSIHESLPRTAEPTPEALRNLDRRIDEFAAAVKALEAAGDPSSGSFVTEANGYIGNLRSLRRDYGRQTIAMALDSSLLSLNISISRMDQAARGMR
jgi:hypothetical protein